MAKFEFPKDFSWGAATSAHQAEGNNHNDWTEWEKKTNHEQSGQACDHYNRFREDFDIAKSLSHNAHRFSIEWSRIESEEGIWNEKEVAHYQEVVNVLRERGIEPFVTLWHWTLPLWVAKQDGWENKKTIADFARYAEKIASSIHGVKFWIILNEPEVYATESYLKGIWPPQKRSFFTSSKVLKNLIDAHKKVYINLKKIQPDAEIGISKNNICFDGLFASFARWWWDRAFLNHIRKYLDFIGLNYYFHKKFFSSLSPCQGGGLGGGFSDMNWEIYPQGIFPVIKELKIYKVPIYITENGLADAKDKKRTKFIQEHIKWIAHAMNDGADVRGYMHWSLLDNFEWDKGFWPRFGLVEVDYQTMERKIRSSAYEYKNIIDSNSIEL